MEWLRETTAIRGTQIEHQHGYLGGITFLSSYYFRVTTPVWGGNDRILF
jgi:hypothetical protein